MKIEKINENQIRCTLTPADLAARQLKISELAYGSEKAKTLFRDMMQQASYDLGFETENFPLMIEAIPAPSDSIVLIITKVSDPEELDTRFSKFTSSGEDSSDNLSRESTSTQSPVQVYVFDSLDAVMEASAALPELTCDLSALFTDEKKGQYMLIIFRKHLSEEEFTCICHILSEYGSYMPSSEETFSYINEQYKAVFITDAITTLAGLYNHDA